MAKLTFYIAIFAAVIVASLMAAPQDRQENQDHEDFERMGAVPTAIVIWNFLPSETKETIKNFFNNLFG